MISIPGGILCAGNLTQDILVWPVEEVVFDTTVWVDDIVTSSGGNGANTSYAVAKLGGSVRLTGAVGADAAGSEAIARLQDAGVDVAYILRRELPTSMTVVMVRSDGARGFFHRPGASAAAFEDAIEFTGPLTAGCAHFHLANPFAMPPMRKRASATLDGARAAGLTTSLDTGWDALGEWMTVVGPCLEGLDLLFVNEAESARLSGHRDPLAGARFFRERGVGTVAVKLGARGCLVSTAEGAHEALGFRVAAVDTTGAGDSFAGAFLAALQKGLGPSEAARLANAAGALSVLRPGATSGLLDYGGTLEWISRQA